MTTNNVYDNTAATCKNENGKETCNLIATGEKRKFRCHYINSSDNAVSRVLELERISHPALAEAGVKAWMERDTDCYNQRYGFLYIQLTDSICYRPNCTGCFANILDYMDGTEHNYSDEYREAVKSETERFLKHVAAIPAAQRMGDCYPNMAVIAAHRAAGMYSEADILTAHRNRIRAEQEAEEQHRKEAAAEAERKRKEEETAETARQVAEEEESLRTKGRITGWGVVQLCDREGIAIHLRTRHNLLEVVNYFYNNGDSACYKQMQGRRKPSLEGCFNTLDMLKKKLGL